MRFIVTNDDGIDAPGLQVLFEAASQLAPTIVVAPAEHQSGCSHRTTTDRPIRVEERGIGRYAVDGTPADCVRLALAHLAPEATWILSGVNDGGNLGADVYLSGTVAAVREALLLGRPGIAFSQYWRRRENREWRDTRAMTRRVLAELLARPLGERRFWNVNFPDEGHAEAPMTHCPVDPHPLPVRFESTDAGYVYRGDYHKRPRIPGADVDVCFTGAIAVSELGLHD